MRVWSLGQEDPLEKEMATQSSILLWEIPWTEEPGGATVHGVTRVRHNWATKQEQTYQEWSLRFSLLSVSCVICKSFPLLWGHKWVLASFRSIISTLTCLTGRSFTTVLLRFFPGPHPSLACPLNLKEFLSSQGNLSSSSPFIASPLLQLLFLTKGVAVEAKFCTVLGMVCSVVTMGLVSGYLTPSVLCLAERYRYLAPRLPLYGQLSCFTYTLFGWKMYPQSLVWSQFITIISCFPSELIIRWLAIIWRRANSLEKTPMLWKIEGERRRGWHRMKRLDGITDPWTWVWANCWR